MQIEKYFILNKYLLSLFGKQETKEILEQLKNVSEEKDIDGHSAFIKNLTTLKDLKITQENLYLYDKNIQEYISKISYKRGNIKLKYFQYLAILFAEIFLDNLKNKKIEFLNNLDQFLQNQDKDVKSDLKAYTEEDLKKLAYWMATGSGKTIISHINYHQFLKYKLFDPDNILFITPNEGLSKQHYDELQKSGINCEIYDGNLNGRFRYENEILIIEITKLAEEKKGQGRTISVDAFGGKNLIFVDEGHKGKKSEEQKWAKLRDKLIEKGFAFEYSATFGQILDKKNPEIFQEYGKAIIFDYSYKYFYLDGYGKDFWVLNVKDSIKEYQETVFVANLLDFYQQLLMHREKENLAKQYNIQKPLWIFVGSTVSGKNIDSDIVKVLSLLKKSIEQSLNEGWIKKKIDEIFSGNYKNDEGQDIFKDKFKNLRNKLDLNDLNDLYKTVFNGNGKLRIVEIKSSEGEFGLKVGENNYFGVVNIGNTTEFKKLLTEFGLEQDVISQSLFDDIKKESSSINILIGSKKFIEGWDTWRVSSMGLLNIGKSEGSQIIQLFGRGIRFKGENYSLKRSDNTEIKILETLNIYGIEADYISKFLDMIRKEDLDLEEIKIPVKILDENRIKWKDLPYPSKDESKIFEREKIIKLNIDKKISFTLDLTPKTSVYISNRENRENEKITEEIIKSQTIIPEEVEKTIYDIVDTDLFDWKNIYLKIIEFKIEKRYWNLYFDIETLKEVLGGCKIKVSDDLYKKDKDLEDLKKIENDILISLLKGYIEKFYKKQKGIFEKEHLFYEHAGDKLKLFSETDKVDYYTVFVKKTETKIINEIKELIQKLNVLFTESKDNDILPRIIIDNSIFIPLLLQNKKVEKISPPELVDSERKFLEGLKDFLNKKKEIIKKYQIALLRNESKSGKGFQLDWAAFYPDFILWIKIPNEKTYIVFIDPKGLLYTSGLNDEKIKFLKGELPTIEINKEINNNKSIKLKGFILSDTKYEDLIKGEKKPESKEKYEENNVFFLEDKEWAGKMFEKIFTE